MVSSKRSVFGPTGAAPPPREFGTPQNRAVLRLRCGKGPAGTGTGRDRDRPAALLRFQLLGEGVAPPPPPPPSAAQPGPRRAAACVRTLKAPFDSGLGFRNLLKIAFKSLSLRLMRECAEPGPGAAPPAAGTGRAPLAPALALLAPPPLPGRGH